LWTISFMKGEIGYMQFFEVYAQNKLVSKWMLSSMFLFHSMKIIPFNKSIFCCISCK
jgi:hypothetical protein